MISTLRLLTVAACAAALPAANLAADPDRDILATAESAGQFDTLLAAVRAAGLEDTLRGEGPFTVFAPTDAAFAALPEGTLEQLLRPEARERLASILSFHVVAGRVSAAAALTAQTAGTVQGERLRFALEAGRLTVQGAAIVANDLQTTNGVIHVVDAVLLPPAPKADRSPPRRALALVELAIDRGVPLFNAGQTAACAAIYEVAASSLLALDDGELSSQARRQLERAVRDAGRIRDAAERAWRLRHALDAAYADLMSAPQTAETPDRGTVVVDGFDDVEAAGWRVVNDTVMGGRSRSALETQGGVASFAGEVSLENNGGFASVRRMVDAGSLAGADGLVLRVRGDGQRYRVNASDRGRVTGDLYQAEFRAPAGAWTEVRVPFAAMERSVMGFNPPNATPVDPAQIRSLGLSIGDKQAGPFRLEIDWIRAF